MLTAGKLRRRPRHFLSFTGMTPEQFDALLAALHPVYERLDRARKNARARERAIGGGGRFYLELGQRLLMTLIYLRLYSTQRLVGYLFDLDDASVSREINVRMLPALIKVLPIPMRDELGLVKATQSGAAHRSHDGPTCDEPTGGQTRPTRRISTLAELLLAHPEFEEVLVDATEEQTPRPEKEPTQRQRYSGKKKRHTLKTQLVTTRALVLHCSGHVPGCVSDLMLLRFTGVLHGVPAPVRVRLDRGYEGVESEYPGVHIEKPIRRPRGHKLTALGKAYNHMQGRLRVFVEHVIARVKCFRVLSGVYRGRTERYDDSFAVCAGLVNFKAMGSLAW